MGRFQLARVLLAQELIPRSKAGTLFNVDSGRDAVAVAVFCF